MQEWKQELDYSKAKLYGFRAGNVSLDDNSISDGRNNVSIAADNIAEAVNNFRQWTSRRIERSQTYKKKSPNLSM
jgi:hypothetical protein